MNKLEQLSAARSKKAQKAFNVSSRTVSAVRKRKGKIKVNNNDAMHHVRQKSSTNNTIKRLKKELRKERIKNSKLSTINEKLNQSLQFWNEQYSKPLHFLKHKTIELIKQCANYLDMIDVDKYALCCNCDCVRLLVCVSYIVCS